MVHWLFLIFKIIVFLFAALESPIENKKGQPTARQIHKLHKDCFTVDKLGFIKKKKYDVQMIVFTTLLEKL